MTIQELALNPYSVLEVSQAASATEITQAFVKATKQRHYPIGAIAAARKQLMNPKDRLIADYLRPILPTVQRLKRTNFSVLESKMPTLELLPQFDRLDAAIAQATATADVDPQLGALLFSSSPVKSASVTASPVRSLEELNSTVADQITEQTQLAWQATPDVEPPSILSNNSLIQTKSDAMIVSGAVGTAIALAIGGIALLFGGARQPELGAVSSNPVSTAQETIPFERTAATDYSTEVPNSFSYPSPPSYQSPSPISSPSPSFTESPAPTSINNASSTSSTQTIESNERSSTENSSFTARTPEDSCGDRDPGGTNTWYPIYINYSEKNLQQARNYFCRDAITTYRETKRLHSIQIASFLNKSEAHEFADLMQREVGSGEVGEGTIYQFTSNKSSSLQERNFSFPRNTCGDWSDSRSQTWYPVVINYTKENLSLVRADYCSDAFRKTVSIQVASFLNRNDADTFAKIIKAKFRRVEIGDSYQH